MPELPEVEIMRQYFEASALDKTIVALQFHDPLFKVFKSSTEELQQALIGSRFIASERIGKYLFAQLDRGNYLHLHFGMTGDLEIFRSESLPKYTRFVLEFEDGDKLAFKDLRKFGVIEVVKDPRSYRSEHGLGEDLLEISLEGFQKGLEGRKVAIKTALLDQKHFAGIGNWIADEMLFNAGIHPKAPCNTLGPEHFEALHEEAQSIVKRAIKEDTHYGDFPKDFFVNYRKEGALHPDHPNSPVERLVVGGRGTFIVPEKQSL